MAARVRVVLHVVIPPGMCRVAVVRTVVRRIGGAEASQAPRGLRGEAGAEPQQRRAGARRA